MHSAHMAEDALREAHRAVGTLMSDRLRSYLPGRMLPILLGRFYDDLAEMLGKSLPDLSERRAVRPAKLDDLTTVELGTMRESVEILADRFTVIMEDPALPQLLIDLRGKLAAEQTDRARIARS